MHNRRPLCTRVQKVLISSRYYIIFSLLKCEIFKTERERECLNVRMLECWNEGLEGLEGLDWKQHEQLVKTTFKRCAG